LIKEQQAMLADAAKPRNDYITVFMPSKGRQIAALAAMVISPQTVLTMNEYKRRAEGVTPYEEMKQNSPPAQPVPT